MDYEYINQSTKRKYESEKSMQKEYGKAIAEGINKFLQAVYSAKNAYDIKSLPTFFMEHLKGNLKEYYSVSLDKKKSKWRLMIQMLDENNRVITPTSNENLFLKSVTKIRIGKLSEHYAEF